MTNQDKAYKYIKNQIISGKYQPGHVFFRESIEYSLEHVTDSDS
jgi:DNA-binding GntR family transcriptional regulator